MIFVAAHVAGVPVEETLLFAGPAVSGAAALIGLELRLFVRRRLSRGRRRRS
jgi:hypothetical protein